ncbi:MAG: twin-arginine translocase TatA/TatE family subunit [Halobacteriovoraceae bacterium]|nr:twin-arginine translocase TatA/TatE family subunit [Halobacteriovoraceae bacterium]|tara:strand:- start:1196 stop:1378 length:183 start_codon:yes stop_codon:yes gene_type:complete
MFGLGTTELVIVLVVVLIFFGGKRLPQLGRSLGSSITNFKKGLKEPDEEKKDQQDDTKSS